MKVRAKVRKIGNSLGIIIPADESRLRGLSEGDEVVLEVEKRVDPKQLFGKFKFTRSSQELKDEARAAWD